MLDQQQSGWVRGVMSRWSAAAHKSGRRRWVRVAADGSVALVMIMIVAVLLIPASPHSEIPPIPSQSLEQPPAPIVETADESVDTAPMSSLPSIKSAEPRPIDVVAYVDNSRHDRDVIPESDGWVERIVKAKPGQRVKQGDVLLELYSPGLVQLQMDYLDGQRRKDALALIEARNRLRAHGQRDESIRVLAIEKKADGVIRVRAPSDGVVTEVYVPEGIFVPQGIAAVSMVDVSSLWMSTTVPAAQTLGLAPGIKVEARSPLLGEEVLQGETVAVDRLADDRDSVTVQVRFDNSRQKLSERQYADVRLYPAQSIATPMVQVDLLDE